MATAHPVAKEAEDAVRGTKRPASPEGRPAAKRPAPAPVVDEETLFVAFDKLLEMASRGAKPLAVLLHFRTLSSLLEALPPKDPLRQITLVLEEPLQGELVMQSSHVSWVRRVSLACSCATSSESNSDDEDDDVG
jgi:hypothetical protein